MKDANNYLLLFLGFFWLAVIAGVSLESRAKSRSSVGLRALLSLALISSGIAFLIGWLINLAAAPWGTVAVAVFFVAYAAFSIVRFGILRRTSYRGDEEL